MKLPERVAVMPLPNAILFPRVLLPLYIFEPRYKKMLANCLADDRMFAVALLPEGLQRKRKNPAPYNVATLGIVRTCIGRPDGSANLILEGIARVHLIRYVQLEPYRIAHIEPLESVLPKFKTTRDSLVCAVAKLAQARAKIGAGLPKSVVKSLLSIQSSDQFSDLVSYTLLDNFQQKQLMLETLDVNQRLRKLVQLLQEQIQQFELWKTLQGKLTNDDVGRN